jgi:hypothetical protein
VAVGNVCFLNGFQRQKSFQIKSHTIDGQESSQIQTELTSPLAALTNLIKIAFLFASLDQNVQHFIEIHFCSRPPTNTIVAHNYIKYLS